MKKKVKGMILRPLFVLFTSIFMVACPFDDDSKDSSSKLSCSELEKPQEYFGVKFVPAFDELEFSEAMSLDFIEDSTDKAFLVQRTGEVYYLSKSMGGFQKKEVLDVSSLLNGVVFADSEHWGITSVATYPDFQNSAYVFLAINILDTLTNRVVSKVLRYSFNTITNTIDPLSKLEIFSYMQAETSQSHHLGQIAFGHDGYLYVGIGDGALVDGAIAAANISEYLGKILRIDVSDSSLITPYEIPSSNPFVGQVGVLEEIFAYGVRNPWTFSFDKLTGQLWVGDVGLSSWEELNKVDSGGFYGWPEFEGNLYFGLCNGCTALADEAIPPYYTYSHDEGVAIFMAYVYRGSAIPELQGTILLSDFKYSYVWGIDPTESPLQRDVILKAYDLKNNPDSFFGRVRPYRFSEDGDGEIYMISTSPLIYKMVKNDELEVTSSRKTVPGKLSSTGCVDMSSPRSAPSGESFFEYDVNSPLWTDGAEKQRWFKLPKGQKATLNSDGKLLFPDGATLVKNFEVDNSLIETRLLVKHQEGWAGYSYKWLEDQSEAYLLDGLEYRDLAGGITWTFPSGDGCFACHADEQSTIGIKVGQLHSSVGGSFIESLIDMELLDDSTFPAWSSLPILVSPDDITQSYHDRAKSYLDANCAHCHNPSGTKQVDIDFRYETNLSNMNVCDSEATFFLNDGLATKRLSPGNALQSVLAIRLGSVGVEQMPPISKSIIDTSGEQVISQWINTLVSCP